MAGSLACTGRSGPAHTSRCNQASGPAKRSASAMSRNGAVALKVLHVIDALGLGGGAEHSLVAVLPLLRDRGVVSSVTCLSPRDGGLQAEVARSGVPVDVMSSRSHLDQVLALRAKVAAERPDLVHATLMRSCLVSRVAMIGAKLPLLNSVVNLFYDPRRADDDHVLQGKLRVLRAVDGVTTRHLVDHVHALTASVADEVVRQLRVDASKITIIPRGRSLTALGAPSE